MKKKKPHSIPDSLVMFEHIGFLITERVRFAGRVMRMERFAPEEAGPLKTAFDPGERQKEQAGSHAGALARKEESRRRRDLCLDVVRWHRLQGKGLSKAETARQIRELIIVNRYLPGWEINLDKDDRVKQIERYISPLFPPHSK